MSRSAKRALFGMESAKHKSSVGCAALIVNAVTAVTIGAVGFRGGPQGTLLILAANCPVCGEPVCLNRSIYLSNKSPPFVDTHTKPGKDRAKEPTQGGYELLSS